MAYRTVFYALQEVFPQVDPRILKEVAIKYSSDADTAVEFVLSDVLPVITENEPTEKYFPLSPDYGFKGKDHSLGLPTRQNLYPTIENYNPNPNFGNATSSSYAKSASPPLMKNPYLEKNKGILIDEASSSSSQFVPNYLNENPLNPFNHSNYDSGKNLIELEDYSNLHYQPLNAFNEPLNAFNAQGVGNSEGNLMDSVISEIFENQERKLENLEGENEISVKIREEKVPLLPKENGNGNELFENENGNKLFENENRNEFELSEAQIISEGNEFQNSEIRIISEENESEEKTTFESLDDLISDMRKNKEILSNALESTIIKMKEVEIEEENAKLAKQEIIETDKKTNSMVENIDHIINTTKETNYEHSREVDKEKFTLENESKELCEKLINLSAQKDGYLSAINEINASLDGRLKAAIEEKERAKMEIDEKERAYLQIRKEKEIVLQELNKESVRLEKETEENKALRDLLLECGRKVDNLQGEISNINLEVISLKEKLNECIQLNTPIIHEIPVPQIPVPEIPESEVPELEIPVSEIPESKVPDLEIPVFEIPVLENPLAPCSLASSNFLEDHESTTFDGAKSILQNDYLSIKEYKNVKEQEKEKEKENNANSSDDEWEIY
ncbi:hypothetical protein LUZ60_011204 [Juncus effusus]|nr:hypothetical protein LUZ60_011204 [Juncus effusus]